MWNNKTFLKISSLVIAICLWMYVMGEVNPQMKTKINNIEVSYINTEGLSQEGLAVREKEKVSINATIRGRRSDVNELKSRGVRATVDVSECTEGPNTCEIVLQLPSGITQESISQDIVTVDVEERVAQEVPVEIQLTGTISSDELVPYVTGLSNDTVMVYGAKSTVQRVKYVQGSISSDRVKKSAQVFEVTLEAMNSKGNPLYGLMMEPDSVRAEAQLLNKKEIPVNVTVENIPQGKELVSPPKEKSVVVIGTSEALQSLDVLQGTVDASEVSRSAKLNVNIDLPEGIYLADEEKNITAAVVLRLLQEE